MKKYLLLTILFFGSAGWAWGQAGGGRVLDEKLQMELGDYFFEEGDYYRAITEYQRFLFFFPRSPRVEEALWKIANSYFQGKKWEDALSACDVLLQRFPASPWLAKALLLKGRCWAEKGEYPRARYFFRRVQEEVAPGKTSSDEARWQTALTYLKEEKWKEAAGEFRKLNPASKLYPRAEFLAQGLDRIDEVPQKSPAGAGILAALLPGAGHLYCERYRDAAVAFVLNGAFIWGMVESFRRENYAVGGILTFFELGWYSGNIYSAVSSAHKYNRDQKKEYLHSLEGNHPLSWGIQFQREYPFLAFRYEF